MVPPRRRGAVPDKAVLHIGTRAGGAPDRLPGRPRTDGVVPPDAPYRTTGPGTLLRAETIDTPISIGSGITTDTARDLFVCGDGMDV